MLDILKMYTIDLLDKFIVEQVLGISKNLLFAIFFEIATSCNSRDYRKLQHRIFKVTSKN